ncbi:hypothetical protein ACF09H_40960 [Streptomyces sp. NPDC014983]|uniref:hypothetical protein n=1 Tax=Streptomyces sp. NPDC014983 TaxID=3364933 RepID=UPI003701F752
MATPNTRKLDRLIADLQSRLESLARGELTFLTASEKTRYAAHIARGGYRVTRGKATGAADRALARIVEEAQQRFTAELSAARAARQQLVTEAAAARVTKQSQGWW